MTRDGTVQATATGLRRAPEPTSGQASESAPEPASDPAAGPAPAGSAASAAAADAQQPARWASFTSYVRERRPLLLRVSRSLSADPWEAEDLLQIALTRVSRVWDGIDRHAAVDGYVRRTLLNTRTSQWRRRRVEEVPCDELPEPEPEFGADPAERQAVRDAVWQAVLALPARQREMVVLRYYEDLSEAETAAALRVSVGTVKSAVSRALCKLRADSRLAAALRDPDRAEVPGAAGPLSPAGAEPVRPRGAGLAA